MLNQRAAPEHVEQLDATAYSEHWYPPIHSRNGDSQFKVITFG
jgi:hypothetical protein